MKKTFLSILLFAALAAASQTKPVTIVDTLKFRNDTTRVASVSSDTALTANSDRILATQRAVRWYVAHHAGSGGGGGSTAWSAITGTPTTVSGYGITDAYPLSGNPSNFLTSITGSNVTSALGYTPYSASNPSNFLTPSALLAYSPSYSVVASKASLLASVSSNNSFTIYLVASDETNGNAKTVWYWYPVSSLLPSGLLTIFANTY